MAVASSSRHSSFQEARRNQTYNQGTLLVSTLKNKLVCTWRRGRSQVDIFPAQPSSLDRKPQVRLGVTPSSSLLEAAMGIVVELGPDTMGQLVNVLVGERGTGKRHAKRSTERDHELDLEVKEILLDVQRRLTELSDRLDREPPMVLRKECYNVKQVSEWTKREGVVSYSEFTIRQACAQGRIPEATKDSTGRRWLIPFGAIQHILAHGLASP